MKFLQSFLFLAILGACYCDSTKLMPGECFKKSDAKYSPNGEYRLFINDRGDLVISRHGTRIWKTNVTKNGAAMACFTDDLQLELRTCDGTVTWTTRSADESSRFYMADPLYSSSHVCVDDAGNLRVTRDGGIKYYSEEHGPSRGTPLVTSVAREPITFAMWADNIGEEC